MGMNKKLSQQIQSVSKRKVKIFPTLNKKLSMNMDPKIFDMKVRRKMYISKIVIQKFIISGMLV